MISFEHHKLKRNRCSNRDSSSCSTSSSNSNISNKKENSVLQKNEFDLSKSNINHNIIHFPKFKDNKSVSKTVICDLSNKSKLKISNQHRTSLEMRLHDFYEVKINNFINLR